MAPRPTYGELKARVRELEGELSRRTVELQTARDRYRLLIETIPHAVQELSPDGTIQLANPAHHRIYGYENGELIGRSLFDVAPTEEGRAALEADFRHIVEDQPPPTPWFGRERTKDGRLIDVQVDWNYIRDTDGRLRGLVAVVTDITERRSCELALRSARDELEDRVEERTAELEQAKRALERDITAREQAERERDHLESKLRRARTLEAVGRLAGGVAHDFNNLLGSLLGCLYAVGQGAAERPEILSEVQTAKELCKRGGDLTRRLLTVARRRPGLWETLHVEAVFRELEPLLKRALPKTVQLSVDLEAGLPSIRVNRSLFTSALVDLAWNAGDAMPDGGSLSFQAESVPGEDRAGAVAIEVADSGRGIPPENQEQIFEPFFTTKEPGRGHGLGLSTAYAAVRECGGEISVRSTPGAGTCFRIVLPAAPAPAAAATPGPGASGSAHPLTGQPLLVVEDEPGIAHMIVDNLRRLGYRTLLASDGLQALETIHDQKSEIALVLLDLALPGVRGEKVYELLQMVSPQLPVLFITGRAGQARALAPERPCLTKPFTERELHHAVALALVGDRPPEPTT